MLDSLLTLTKRGAFWLAALAVVSALLSFGISMLTGQIEPIFALMSLAAFGALLVTGVYTLAKRIFGFGHGRDQKTPSGS